MRWLSLSKGGDYLIYCLIYFSIIIVASIQFVNSTKISPEMNNIDILTSFIQTQGFDDYFNQMVKESGGAVRRSVVEAKRLNATVDEYMTECETAAQQFVRANNDKLPFVGEVFGRAQRFVSDVKGNTQIFCQRSEHYAKQSLSFVSEILPLCKAACPGLFPSSILLYNTQTPDELNDGSEPPVFLEISNQLNSEPQRTTKEVEVEQDNQSDNNNNSSESPNHSETNNNNNPITLPPNRPEEQTKSSSHRHHHHPSSSSSSSQSLQANDFSHTSKSRSSHSKQQDDPATLQLQAAQDIWNGGSDFKSATDLFKQGILDLSSDFHRSFDSYIQQSRFSPLAGDAFRKGGLDSVKATSEWSERNEEIVRNLRNEINDVFADQLRLVEKLSHLAFESLEVCRACNIPIPSTSHRAIDIGLLRAKALTKRD